MNRKQILLPVILIKSLPCFVLWMTFITASTVSADMVIDTVFVGNAGNSAQSVTNRSHGFSGGDNRGQVAYNYYIGTYMVTNAQYSAFLNAVASTSDPHGLYNVNMGGGDIGGIRRLGSGTTADPWQYSPRTPPQGPNTGNSMANMPVNFVSFWDAARFTNWLTTGDTETGVYMLNGVTTPANDTIIRNQSAWESGGIAIASMDEWYKAAYYNPITESYSLFATGSDLTPNPSLPNSTDNNSSNYNNIFGSSTPVGSYSIASSAYGTYDQSGNLWEWNDEIITAGNRRIAGGSFSTGVNSLRSDGSIDFLPTNEFSGAGFRIVSLQPIPEPSTYGKLLGSLVLLIAIIRRKSNKIKRLL